MAAYGLVMSLVVMVAGKAILGFLGVQVDDFRIAGGSVPLTIALGRRWVCSAAFPTMVGPGTITTLIVLTGGSDGAGGYVAVAAALVIVVLALLLVLWSAPAIGHHIGCADQSGCG